MDKYPAAMLEKATTALTDKHWWLTTEEARGLAAEVLNAAWPVLESLPEYALERPVHTREHD
jgi:hypothetical protein